MNDLKNNHGLINEHVPWDIAFNSMGESNKSYVMALQKHGGLTADPKINMAITISIFPMWCFLLCSCLQKSNIR